jgi:hypothetical protein
VGSHHNIRIQKQKHTLQVQTLQTFQQHTNPFQLPKKRNKLKRTVAKTSALDQNKRPKDGVALNSKT